MTYTLDTNIISYLFNFTIPEHKDFLPIFADSSKKYLKNEHLLVTNPIIKGESIGGFQGWIHYGKRENADKQAERQIIMTNTIEFLFRIKELGFHEKAYSIYGILKKEAKTKFSHPRGGQTKRFYELYNDIWIGTLCIAHNSILVTNNIRDFEWMKPLFPQLDIIQKDDFIAGIK